MDPVQNLTECHSGVSGQNWTSGFLWQENLMFWWKHTTETKDSESGLVDDWFTVSNADCGANIN